MGVSGSKFKIKTDCSDKVQITERSRHKHRETLFRENLFSYSVPKERVKPRKSSQPSTNWFGFSSHLGQCTDNKPPLRLLSLPRSLPQTGGALPPLDSPTRRKDRASPTCLLYGSAKHSRPPASFRAQTAERSQRPGIYQSATGLEPLLRFGGPLFTGLHCCKTFFIPSCDHLLKSSSEHTITYVSWFAKHEQLLSACCILIHWEYSSSKHQTDCFRVNTSKCFVP